MPVIILIRHQTPDNPQNILYGANIYYDFPLSLEGKQNAFNLGINFAFTGIQLSAIVRSTLIRAHQTGMNYIGE